ncbi:MAG: ATP-dependent Clp protease ATP-binding subunit [Phycisphaerae bacterium]|nr:ATP-dependent Clp protease ATP-binding subunit [Phycisphaerae bacterium]
MSERSRKVIRLANEIAHEYEQEYVGTEHLLLAIAREGSGAVAQFLKGQGVGEDEIKDKVDQLIKQSMEDTWVFGRLPGTPHFRNVMAGAIEEAGKFGSKEIKIEHLLLGLLREKGSVAETALADLGITLSQAQKAIAKLVKGKEE